MNKNKRYLIYFILLLGLVSILLVTLKPALSSRWRSLLSAVVASRLVDLANKERAELHLSNLSFNEVLNQAAQKKAEDMAARGYFSHVSPDGQLPWYWLEESGYAYQAAGENLAINFTESELLNRAWMNSPLHRANIVRPEFQDIGVGIARGTYKGGSAVFVVQYFGTPASSTSH